VKDTKLKEVRVMPLLKELLETAVRITTNSYYKNYKNTWMGDRKHEIM
jgi:hypothetical protein